MKKIEVIEGVVAELNGKYWGSKYKDEGYFFGDIENAKIADSIFCTKATDMTYTPTGVKYNHYYEQLKLAKLMKVKKTITTEFEFLNENE